MKAKRGPYPGKPSGLGKGILQRAVTEAGMSRRQAALAVDVVIDTWKNALAHHEEVELPIGKLKIVKRDKRRVFQSKPNLKGIKRTLYEVHRKPYSVQLVKKKLPGEPTAPPRELDARVLPALPVATNEPASQVSGRTWASRPVRMAHVDQQDLRGRFQTNTWGSRAPSRLPGIRAADCR